MLIIKYPDVSNEGFCLFHGLTSSKEQKQKLHDNRYHHHCHLLSLVGSAHIHSSSKLQEREWEVREKIPNSNSALLLNFDSDFPFRFYSWSWFRIFSNIDLIQLFQKRRESDHTNRHVQRLIFIYSNFSLL